VGAQKRFFHKFGISVGILLARWQHLLIVKNHATYRSKLELQLSKNTLQSTKFDAKPILR
jgi:hypothetical protein